MMMKTLDYYMSLPYYLVIVEDKTEGGYTAYYPELPGCVTCAEKFEQIKDETEDAKRAWIESEIEMGHEIPIPSLLNDYLAVTPPSAVKK